MATRNSGYAAKAFNKFYTPAWVVSHDLASVWQPPPRCEFWEPCAGNGGMARAIEQSFGQRCLATDVKPDARQLMPVTPLDFLDASWPSAVAHLPLAIISNFPYGPLADKCLAQALRLTEPSGGSVCALFPFGFDAGRGRKGLIAYHPAFAAKVLCSKRIRWTNIRQAENGPSGDHAWFIWEWQTRRRNAWLGRQLQVAPGGALERSGVAA